MTVANYNVETVPVDEVYALGNRRACDMAAVNTIAESIKKIGLQTPITVWAGDAIDPETSEELDGYRLIAGRHRLEAYRQLGEQRIPAIIRDCSESEARMWEIAENLHRAELTALERDEQIAEWVDLAKAVSAQPAPKPQGGRPESGERKAARDLNIERTAVQRAVKVAKLSDEAKTAAVDAGLDDNRTALLSAAKHDEPSAQVEAIRNYIPVRPVSPAPGPLNDIETKEQWMAAMMRLWNRASADWRDEFLSRATVR